jgi:hypothetical protein
MAQQFRPTRYNKASKSNKSLYSAVSFPHEIKTLGKAHESNQDFAFEVQT